MRRIRKSSGGISCEMCSKTAIMAAKFVRTRFARCLMSRLLFFCWAVSLFLFSIYGGKRLALAPADYPARLAQRPRRHHRRSGLRELRRVAATASPSYFRWRKFYKLPGAKKNEVADAEVLARPYLGGQNDANMRSPFLVPRGSILVFRPAEPPLSEERNFANQTTCRKGRHPGPLTCRKGSVSV